MTIISKGDYRLQTIAQIAKEGYRELPIAEEISSTELSIPMYYGMKDEEIHYVIDKVNEFLDIKSSFCTIFLMVSAVPFATATLFVFAIACTEAIRFVNEDDKLKPIMFAETCLLAVSNVLNPALSPKSSITLSIRFFFPARLSVQL